MGKTSKDVAQGKATKSQVGVAKSGSAAKAQSKSKARAKSGVHPLQGALRQEPLQEGADCKCDICGKAPQEQAG